MTQLPSRKLVCLTVVTAALKHKPLTHANTDNTTRPREAPVARQCSYIEFMSCQPINFKGTEGAVGLIRWFERTESVFFPVIVESWGWCNSIRRPQGNDDCNWKIISSACKGSTKWEIAHLKCTYEGTNLLAVEMDGNNQIIPIATDVSQGETGPSWTWFLSKLKECIGEVPNLSIISDRHAAIKSACQAVFPNAFHDAPLNELSDWAITKITKRRQKSVNWIVGTIDRVMGLIDFNHLAKGWFRRKALEGTYQELVYLVGEVSSWQCPNYLHVVKPPLMDKKPAGRPKRKARIRSQGKEPVPVRCGRCGARGHNQNSCRETIPQKKTRYSQQEHSYSEQGHYYSQQAMPFSFEASDLNDS
ncbi:transposase, MuDR, MULE transposase domain protein [Tanacetum coccineum]